MMRENPPLVTLSIQPLALLFFVLPPVPIGPEIRAAKPFDTTVSFVNDVVPVLTRAGCNAGTCHGAAAGKNGFKLSLCGHAPEQDFNSITRLAGARRESNPN